MSLCKKEAALVRAGVGKFIDGLVLNQTYARKYYEKPVIWNILKEYIYIYISSAVMPNLYNWYLRLKSVSDKGIDYVRWIWESLWSCEAEFPKDCVLKDCVTQLHQPWRSCNNWLYLKRVKVHQGWGLWALPFFLCCLSSKLARECHYKYSAYISKNYITFLSVISGSTTQRSKIPLHHWLKYSQILQILRSSRSAITTNIFHK